MTVMRIDSAGLVAVVPSSQDMEKKAAAQEDAEQRNDSPVSATGPFRLRRPNRTEGAGRFRCSRAVEADYELVENEVLGTGLSGRVHAAVCRHTGRKLAVKSFVKNQLSARQQGDLQREVDLYMSLDHPNVCRLEGVYDNTESVHLVMERLEGGELFDRLAAVKQMTEPEAAGVVRQILSAVSYLHAHKVVHRDLKLENVMFERRRSSKVRHTDPKLPKEQVKIIDFGLSTVWDGHTELSQRCGTLRYAAPEVFNCKYTEKADLWSIGAITYMLLTGQALYNGAEAAIQQKVRGGKIDCARSFLRLSLEAMNFVRALLLMNPRVRPSATSALNHPWIRRHAKPNAPVDAGVLASLKDYSQASHLRRACMIVVSWSLPRDDEELLREQFQAIDANGSGAVSLEDLSRAFEAAGRDQAEAAAVLASLDADGDGEISYREFLSGGLAEGRHLREDCIRVAFARFDTDGQGLLTEAGFCEVLGDSRGELCACELLDQADCTEDLVVGFEDFRAQMLLPDRPPATAEDLLARKNKALVVESREPEAVPEGNSDGEGDDVSMDMSGYQIQPFNQAASGLAALWEMLGAFRSFWGAANKLARLVSVVRGLRLPCLGYEADEGGVKEE